MIEKLEQKINKEIEKIINKEDLSLEELKILVEIKSGIELTEKIKNDELFKTPNYPQFEITSDGIKIIDEKGER